ncbi:hypothetical protein ABH924_003510 [Arthrobacter sp. GAS37]|uniref:hypothetical protein n=1 Tax=Arthrobacter sp. GAS37 TaxID=3156261 RepID=UPI003836A5A6
MSLEFALGNEAPLGSGAFGTWARSATWAPESASDVGPLGKYSSLSWSLALALLD